MKEYYLERFRWIFNYTRKDFGYCLLKTLCVIVGLPIYAVAFAVEMLFTAINMIFCWIPILNVIVMIVCKAIVWLFGLTFYINVLPDLKEYNATHTIVYEIADSSDELDESTEADEEAEERRSEQQTTEE